jgi:serine protease inhibitor
MKLKTLTIAFCCLCLGFATAACAPTPTAGVVDNPTNNGGSTLELAVSEPLQAPPDGFKPEYEQIAGSTNAFALRLTQELRQRSTTENFVCSPYSVYLPLAALVNATSAEKKPELLAALGAGGLSATDLNEAAAVVLNSLTNANQRESAAADGEEPYNPLQIANAVFVDQDVTLRQSFAETLSRYYLGQAMTVNFGDPAAVQAVNQWASDHTEGLITDIVQEFSADTVAALANAIYFSDRWVQEFDPEQTEAGAFYALSGVSSADYMMLNGFRRYYEDTQIQAVALPFINGGNLLILLPKAGDADTLLKNLDADYFATLQDGLSQREGNLLLPRFAIDSGSFSVLEALEALGVPLFDAVSAPLDGLVEENIPVWLGGAVQKAVIEVDEKGTTAAAVSVMMAATSALLPPDPPFTMNCDHPFVFVLTGNTQLGGQILFTGIVNDPAA